MKWQSPVDMMTQIDFTECSRPLLERACELFGFPHSRLPDDRPPVTLSTSECATFMYTLQANAGKLKSSLYDALVAFDEHPECAAPFMTAYVLGGPSATYELLEELLKFPRVPGR